MNNLQDFNPAIFDRLIEYNIEETDAAILYLLAIYYGLGALYIPQGIITQVNIAKIMERDYDSTKGYTIKWNIPLFVEASKDDTPDAWTWVDEFRSKFAALRSDARGDKRGTVTKMKKFFAENPDVRKDEVLRAADIYLAQFKASQDVRYVQQADYFISKINKGEKTSRLSTFIELVREMDKQKKLNSNQGNRFNQQVRS